MKSRRSEENRLLSSAVTVGAALFVFIFLQKSMGIVVFDYLDIKIGFLSEADSRLLIGNICTYLIAGGACALIMLLAKRAPVGKKCMGIGGFIEALLIAVAVVYSGNLIGNAVTVALGGDISILYKALSGNVYITAVSVAVIAPVCEELIFRYMMIPRLLCYGERTAVVFSALGFAMIHGNFLQFFYAFGVGILFGYIYTKTGKILYTMLIHSAINVIGAVVSTIMLDRGGIYLYVFVAVDLLIAAIGLFLLCRRLPRISLSSPVKGSLASKKRVFLYLNPFSLTFYILSAAAFLISVNSLAA